LDFYKFSSLGLRLRKLNESAKEKALKDPKFILNDLKFNIPVILAVIAIAEISCVRNGVWSYAGMN